MSIYQFIHRIYMIMKKRERGREHCNDCGTFSPANCIKNKKLWRLDELNPAIPFVQASGDLPQHTLPHCQMPSQSQWSYEWDPADAANSFVYDETVAYFLYWASISLKDIIFYVSTSVAFSPFFSPSVICKSSIFACVSLSVLNPVCLSSSTFSQPHCSNKNCRGTEVLRRALPSWKDVPAAYQMELDILSKLACNIHFDLNGWKYFVNMLLRVYLFIYIIYSSRV